jgi:type I restriction-modification system DNA methylase subunit
MDFIDLGLIPALECHIKPKLDRFLRQIIAEADVVYNRKKGHPADVQQMFRLIFRLLAAKVLHDRDISPFDAFSGADKVPLILEAVARYYSEDQPILSDVETQRLVALKLWEQVDFRNLSVEVLAYIYENTLVDPKLRRQLGTHSTPYSLARYVVHHLPIEKSDDADRLIVEPFSGHGIFLVAALQRLRDLLPGKMDEKQRHRYFVKMLRGFEIDTFALEVSKLCLMLADFPNHNGWRLENEDVFISDKLPPAVQKARFILSNPPFEDFSPGERKKYPNLRSVHKPVEFLHRVFDNLNPQAMLGIVLPRQCLDGAGYKLVRKALAERFQEFEIVTLPDRVFEKSQQESVLLITTATAPKPGQATVSFTEVREKDRESFLREYGYTRRDVELVDPVQAETTLVVPPLGEVWERLSSCRALGEVAEVHRGIEWQAPFDRQRYVSPVPKPGFRPGLDKAAGRLACFEVPKPVYLSMMEESRRAGAYSLPWDRPKVIANAARASRGPWRVVAFEDGNGLVCSQRFHAIWPKSPWTTRTISAILNGPVASAFVAVHEANRDIRRKTLSKIPLPGLGLAEMAVIDSLVESYVALVQGQAGQGFTLQDPSSHRDRATNLLLQIDALVLKGYNLPPRLERELLEFFRGEQRHVPFEFVEYFPEGFRPHIPLWMYVAPNFKLCTAKNFLASAPRVTDPELIGAFHEVE